MLWVHNKMAVDSLYISANVAEKHYPLNIHKSKSGDLFWRTGIRWKCRTELRYKHSNLFPSKLWDNWFKNSRYGLFLWDCFHEFDSKSSITAVQDAGPHICRQTGKVSFTGDLYWRTGIRWKFRTELWYKHSKYSNLHYHWYVKNYNLHEILKFSVTINAIIRTKSIIASPDIYVLLFNFSF